MGSNPRGRGITTILFGCTDTSGRTLPAATARVPECRSILYVHDMDLVFSSQHGRIDNNVHMIPFVKQFRLIALEADTYFQ